MSDIFSQLDDLYQPEITDLEKNEYQGIDQPVVYLNDVKALLKADTAVINLLTDSPKAKKKAS